MGVPFFIGIGAIVESRIQRLKFKNPPLFGILIGSLQLILGY